MTRLPKMRGTVYASFKSHNMTLDYQSVQYVQETFTHILSILEMIIMKLIGSLMIMPIVKILLMTIIIN
jgi:hypothetical protein